MKNMLDFKFERLTVKRKYGVNRHRKITWLCECDCGNVVVVAGTELRSGNTGSCGCLHVDIITKHGESALGRNHSAEYRAWNNMKSRCGICRERDFRNYGARGISICDRWKSFENFLEDMGRRPSNKHSLDRIDVNGNYCKENCRWATLSQQGRNRRNNSVIEINGVKRCIYEWAEISGVKPGTLMARARKIPGRIANDSFLKPAIARRGPGNKAERSKQ